VRVSVVSFYVYMLASRRNGTLYIGMTDDLVRRVWEHRTGAVPGFTKTYGVKMLVWFEQHETREAALVRERQLKKWNRAWKLELIERQNASWCVCGMNFLRNAIFIHSFPRKRAPSRSSVHSRESGNPDFPLGLGPRLREDERVMLSDQVATQIPHPFIPAKAGIRIFR
jgi:putative endonuclease